MSELSDPRATGSLQTGPDAFSRYLRCLEEWSYWHVEQGWTESESGRLIVEFLDAYEATHEGGDR